MYLLFQVLFFEFMASLGAAILTIMPHLDIVTIVTMLNDVAVFSAVLHRQIKEPFPGAIHHRLYPYFAQLHPVPHHIHYDFKILKYNS